MFIKSSTILHTKKVIRLYIRTLRKSLNYSEQYTASQLITNKIINLKQIHQAQHIAIYISFDGEINTNLLIKTLLMMNKHVYLPVLPLSSKSSCLLFYQYNLSTPLIKNSLNIYEPIYKKNNFIPLQKLNLLFIPLVAFDIYGNRLGMGGGFYDKTIKNWKKHIDHNLIGLGYDFQKIPSQILPIEPWDIKLPIIITPSYLYTN